MATPRKTTPSVIVLTEDDLRRFMETVQQGFGDLNSRLDALEQRIVQPAQATAKLRQEIATAALKAATSHPSRQVPRRSS